MDFYPTKHEKYASALRLYLHRIMQKRGASEEIIENLKKVYIFECVTSLSAKKKIANGFAFFDALFSKIHIFSVEKGATISISIEVFENISVDFKSISVLLGMICSKITSDSNLKVSSETVRNFLKITLKGISPDDKSKRIAAYFGATILFEIKSEKTVLFFPLYNCENKVPNNEFSAEIKALMLFMKDCL